MVSQRLNGRAERFFGILDAQSRAIEQLPFVVGLLGQPAPDDQRVHAGRDLPALEPHPRPRAEAQRLRVFDLCAPLGDVENADSHRAETPEKRLGHDIALHHPQVFDVLGHLC